MINPWKIIGKMAKYLIAITLTVLLGTLAASCMNEKDTLTFLGGVGICFAIVAGWVVLIAKEVNAYMAKTEDVPAPPDYDEN